MNFQYLGILHLYGSNLIHSPPEHREERRRRRKIDITMVSPYICTAGKGAAKMARAKNATAPTINKPAAKKSPSNSVSKSEDKNAIPKKEAVPISVKMPSAKKSQMRKRASKPKTAKTGKVTDASTDEIGIIKKPTSKAVEKNTSIKKTRSVRTKEKPEKSTPADTQVADLESSKSAATGKKVLCRFVWQKLRRTCVI